MQENHENGLEKLTSMIDSAVTGIPAPIKKNFFKAIGQLCTAAVDVPVAWLEGKSSEIRAATEARIQITKKGGETIAEELQVPPEYIKKASTKFASRIIQEQINLDEITLNATQELSNKEIKDEGISEKEIEGDWLNEFESHARLKSSDEMKIIFGKILSGEILNPGTFSIKTIRLISQLDNRAAKLFQLLCSQSISMRLGGKFIRDARVVSFSGNAASNSLSAFSLSFDNLNILHEYGLIISDYNSRMSYSPCIANDNTVIASIFYDNKHYCLLPIDNEKYDKELKLNGVAFTKAGNELLDIIPIVTQENYTQYLVKNFEEKHLQFVELTEKR